MVERCGIGPLMQAPVLHYADRITNGKCLQLVVGHEKGGGACGFQNVTYLKGQALAQLHIQVGEWLVQQHQLWAGRKRSGQRHALLLATG